MATVEKIGNQYRMSVGYSDHNEIWQMLPDGWTPGQDDTVLSAEAQPAHIETTTEPPDQARPSEPAEITTKKSSKHAR